MNQTQLESAATGLLVLCALVVTSLVVRREMGFGSNQTPKPKRINSWVQYGASSKWIGERSAPIRIVEFADFQCPFCARNAATIQKLQSKYPNKIALVYRSFPLTLIHREAHVAALAAECAADQGRFREFHDLLYAKQDSIGIIEWTSVAERVRVPDLQRFARCLEHQQGIGRVLSDSSAGVKLKVMGTPTLLVNDLLLPGGAPSEEELDGLIQKQLKTESRAARDL